MIVASDTDVQRNFDRYLQSVQSGDEIIILKNGKEAARLVSYDSSFSFLTDSLTGILKNDYDDKKINMERIEKR